MARTFTGPRWAVNTGHHARALADSTLGDRIAADRYTTTGAPDRATVRGIRLATDGNSLRRVDRLARDR